jgi:hypothetical protein
VRLAADMIADIRTLPPTEACPSVRAVLEARLEFVTEQLSGHDGPASSPMAREFVRVLRAETTDHRQAVEAAQPLVTVAANLAQLELVSIAKSETVSATTNSAAE